MGSGIGERENKFAVGGVEIEEYPVVFDVAVSQSLKIAGERMVFVLRRQGVSHGEGADNCGNLIYVLPAFEHLFEALPVTGGLADRIFHASINSMILSGSAHVGGELKRWYRKIAWVLQEKPSWGVLFWSCGSCLSDMGRFEFFMGRFAAAHGGALTVK